MGQAWAIETGIEVGGAASPGSPTPPMSAAGSPGAAIIADDVKIRWRISVGSGGLR